MTIEIKLYDGAALLGDLAPYARACRLDLGAYGCGALRLRLGEKWRADRGVRAGHDLRIYRDGALLWRGWVRQTVKRLGDDSLAVDATGYAWKLRGHVLTAANAQTFTSQAPETIAQSLWTAVIQPAGDIASFQSDASGQTLDSYAASAGRDLWSIFDRLALAAGGWIWGVDENLELFFKNPADFGAAPLHTFDLGVDVLDLAQTRSDLAINDVTVEGASYNERVEHAASIAANGRRYRIVRDPGVSTSGAAQLLAAGVFSRWAGPSPWWSVRAQAPAAALRPWTGRLAVRDPQREADGSIVLSFGSVHYDLLASGAATPIVEFSLGALDGPAPDDVFTPIAPAPTRALSTVANPEHPFDAHLAAHREGSPFI